MSNAARIVWDLADSRADAVAVRDDRRKWTYRDVKARTAGFAAALGENGVGRGDRVLLVVPTTLEFVPAYLGILAAGAVAVTVNPMCTEPELSYFVEDSGARLVVSWHETGDAARAVAGTHGLPLWELGPGFAWPAQDAECAEVEPGDLAVLLYTSGTTGHPKGAELSHGNIMFTVRMYVRTLSLDGTDRMGTALPLFHVYGQVAVLRTALEARAQLSLLRPFSGAAAVGLIAGHGLTTFSGVPTMWAEMLRAATGKEQFSTLRLASSGGAALPDELARGFHTRFGVTILDGYGLSETTSAGTVNRPGIPAKPGSAGKAQPGLDIAILDDQGEPVAAGEIGEVAVAGPAVMQGYWNRPDATAEAMRGRWLRTGDLGRLDDDGYLWIVDRKKELVIRGGYNVYPREIEERLYEHPAIREAVVVGVPDARLGEEVAAVVVAEPGQDLDLTGLRAWLSERLAAYKVPRLYQVIERLPRGNTGKVLKRALDREEIRRQATYVGSGNAS
ncbi:AMP-binding protein [Amycolatopsis pithecellobii]|uniref:AMP-binding protein n=1 Tax=Amycolatopsis pithecellobii TaxID=664692 RepID=A0A6N7YMW7_9PSEU|nr:AMP-binding protein [Amycolatopsis pithecellobii]MTD53362.1 AMP-binding protein [Amycolatopsis pithecellobii]